jgi:1-acyl-sn-glycerol-3-phosphate acyltransferase
VPSGAISWLDRHGLFSPKLQSLLYSCLKPFVRLGMIIFCRKVIINRKDMLAINGPLLIACNHPNSFLDSVIINTLFKQPVWSLARGDVFRKRFVRRILKGLKILPVYRTTEGVENLSENYKTFTSCVALFRKNGVVHIFSEGKCINEWHLRPLKKGTARLSIQAWEEGIPLKVLPAGINYSSFRRFGKNIFLNFGDLITREDIKWNDGDGIRHQSFNMVLHTSLKQLVMEIPKDDMALQKEKLELTPALSKKIILFIPAVIGWILHAPLFLPLRWITKQKAANSDHYDSILTALLVLTYPVYLVLITTLTWALTGYWQMLLLLIVAPFCAWAFTQLKGQLDKK